MILRLISWFLGLIILGSILSLLAALYIFDTYGNDLPNYSSLRTYEPPTMTRVHAADGQLLKEYATEPRVFVPIEAMPANLINAFLAAEDDSFYSHKGISIISIFRALITNISNYKQNKRPIGASTITQQVAKNFFLSNELSFERKIKEAILAFRIERFLEKDRILELYLNEIYLGMGSYGVAAAALAYFDKSIDQLSLQEVAYLAALPKAPNHYHPFRKTKEATNRRNWVLSRMHEEDFISASEANISMQMPLRVYDSRKKEFVKADYFVEEIRKYLIENYDERGLYEGGMSVRTTLDPKLQEIADKVLTKGLENYDRRHGWRGPIDKIILDDMSKERLLNLEEKYSFVSWKIAVVKEVNKNEAKIIFSNDTLGLIPKEEVLWARKWNKGQKIGSKVKSISNVISIGDVVFVEPKIIKGELIYSLRQIPDIEGAIVAMDPHTGRVLAMVGGYSFIKSEFNRATQAKRQPGSAFKPFVYLAALENGFTPASKILDAPFVVDQGAGQGWWKPANYTNKFYGPSTLRLGVEKSRNLMTVRLAQFLGMDIITNYANKFGITKNMPELLSMSLGAGETTLIDITAAYAMLVNGGKFIKPSLIDRIQDRRGITIMSSDERVCDKCKTAKWSNQNVPKLLDNRQEIVSSEAAYQVVSMLEGVVQRGTGRRIKSLGKHLAGKTGTTNDGIDAWFIGFSADLVVGVFVGFDQPKTLGPNEQGASVAAPIFKNFMKAALDNKPDIPFRIPKGVRLVRIDAKTGLIAEKNTKKVLLEAFRPGSEPKGSMPVLDKPGNYDNSIIKTGSGTGGLY